MPISTISSVQVQWRPDNSAFLYWRPLAYTEAGGIPLYIVSYKSVDGSSTGSVNTTSSSVVITGLSSQNEYRFTIRVAVGNGNETSKGSEHSTQLFIVQIVVYMHMTL